MRRLLLLSLALLFACAAPPAARRPLPAPAERFDEPNAAAEFHARKRGLDSVADARALYRVAHDTLAAMPRYSTQLDREAGPPDRAAVNAASTRVLSTWTSLGPGNIGGRTRTLVFDPVDPRIMYAGGVSGGVWKTTDGGQNWTPIGDRLANLAINSLIIDPLDRNTLFAGTGEGYFREEVRGTALPIRGDGIFMTRDAGLTWTQLPTTAGNVDFHWVNDLVFSPRDSSRIYAATRTGVFRSTDRGVTWKRVHGVTVKGGCTDLAVRPDTATDTVFAACGVFEQATIYRSQSAEADAPWSAVFTHPQMSRTTLAIAPSNPSVIYALAASNAVTPPWIGDQHLLGVFRSDAGGDAGSWTTRTTFADDSFENHVNRLLLTNPITATCGGDPSRSVPMGWHCNVIAVDPTNADRVWVGGVDLFRSDDGGRKWGAASYWWAQSSEPQFVHADQHAIVFHPGYDGASNQTLFVANDGGIYKTSNPNGAVNTQPIRLCTVQGEVSWSPLNNNFGVTQFYHGAVFPDGRQFAGGAQDNGSLFGSIDDGPNQWVRNFGGDGAYIAIDQVDPRFVIAESQYGNVVRSTNGGRNFVSTQLPFRGNGNQYLFITPIVIDPNVHTRVWVGGATIYRSENSGGAFTAASTSLASKVSTIAVAPGRSERVIAGSAEGFIYRTEVATTASSTTQWASTRPRSGFVSSVAFDPVDPNIAWATYAGFGGGTHVWRSSDGGATWQPRDGSGDATIPDIPVHSIAIDPTRPGRIFLGTDLGVMVSTDGGARWMVEDSGFAAVITEWVTIGQGAIGPAIYAFTHGRGVWRAELTTPSPRRRTVR